MQYTAHYSNGETNIVEWTAGNLLLCELQLRQALVCRRRGLSSNWSAHFPFFTTLPPMHCLLPIFFLLRQCHTALLSLFSLYLLVNHDQLTTPWGSPSSLGSVSLTNSRAVRIFSNVNLWFVGFLVWYNMHRFETLCWCELRFWGFQVIWIIGFNNFLVSLVF